MTDVIYSTVGCFTSVREPFIHDRFVQSIFTKTVPVAEARKRYAGFLKDRPLLPLLLSALAQESAEGGAVEVVDCGVFMGNFAVAADIQAARAGVPIRLTAYEANPALVDPIKANFEIYDVPGAVHGNGIGGAYETVTFVHSPEGMIGGTVFSTDLKSRGDASYQSVDCQVVPLKSVLAEQQAPGLVKIDIEGNEVDAFGSVLEDAALLHNVFIVEYAPYQGVRMLGDETYNDFLLRHFAVFDINNWLWFPYARPLTSPDALSAVMEAHPSRPDNTDLLLIPRSMTGLIAQVEGFAPKPAP